MEYVPKIDEADTFFVEEGFDRFLHLEARVIGSNRYARFVRQRRGFGFRRNNPDPFLVYPFPSDVGDDGILG